MKHRSRRGTGLTLLGFVIQGDNKLRVPASVEASPIAHRDWEAAVGTRIAARARPLKLERGVLLVRTASSTWAQELALLSDAIITQLRARNVAVDSLRFRVGPVDAPERPPSRDEVRTSPPEVKLPASVAHELELVEDPELRAIIARAAAKNLGWQVANAAPEAQRRATRDAAVARRRADPPPQGRPPQAPATATRPGARGPRSA